MISPATRRASAASVHVILPGPVDIPRSLEPFRRSGDDLLDRWDGVHLLRTIRIGSRIVAYCGTPVGSVDEPAIDVAVEDELDLAAVVESLKATFVADPAALAGLVAADPLIARLEGQYRGLRPVRQFDLLTALVRSISAQQVNLRWAATTRARLARTFGRRHVVAGQEVWSLAATALAGLAVADIRALQFTTRKAEYIIGAAEAVARGHLDLATLQSLPDDAVIAQLTALRGIGVWTAEWLLARTLGRPRVAAGDLAVRKAVGLAYLHDPLPRETAVRQATAHWGAAAGVAQALVLHALVDGALAAG